ncbi:MAG: queuosine precursor transporter [Polyangiaceae bacterium]|nr:queuosine precursor transporter [Polyangiaceae bacterium]
MFLDTRHKLFLVLAATFITCLIVGDIIGGKLVQTHILGFEFTTTVGMLPFPVTFLLTDVLNEFYGQKAARFVTLVGFGMAVVAFVVIAIAGAIPIAPMAQAADWTGVTEQAFNNVFLGSQRMLVASLCAYLVAQFVDIAVFHALKRLSHNRYLWLRATGSTVASQLIDTITINFVAWSGMMSVAQIVNIIFSAYGLKIMIAVGLTPLVYLCHGLVQKGLGLAPVVLAPED